MVAPKNIIKKVQIGVNTPSLANGMQLKDELGEYFKREILPEIDLYFNSFQKNEKEIIRFDRISLKISIKEKDTLKDLKNLIISRLIKIVNKETILNANSNNFKRASSDQNETDAFLYFLERGTLPWWFEKKPNMWKAVFEKTNFNSETLKKLKNLFSKEEIRKRLIYQFDDNQLFKIVNYILVKAQVNEWENKVPQNYRIQFWEAMLLYSIHKEKKEIEKIYVNVSAKEASNLLNLSKEITGINIPLTTKKAEDLKNKTPFEQEKLLNENKNNTSEIEIKADKEGILIQNAGLILLHPFLKMFFEKMDFLSEKNIKPEKIDEAIHVLHYLTTGKEQPYEYELIFEKFLCNLPLHHPVNRHILLTKEQKMACEILLEAVLGHWVALQSNSTAILQNEFLQREGKLTISEEKQQLFIPRKTQDILLDKLPWNLHLIKFPWKKKILFVDW